MLQYHVTLVRETLVTLVRDAICWNFCADFSNEAEKSKKMEKKNSIGRKKKFVAPSIRAWIKNG